VELTAVGVDIGSTTSQLMFSRVHLRRERSSLSSRYVAVARDVMWRSPVRLTPYLDDGLIDAAEISAFVRRSYADAGVAPAGVDTGAIILTGEALKRANARPLADAVAGESGDFVCVISGHDLEATLSAHGSGSVELSRTDHGQGAAVRRHRGRDHEALHDPRRGDRRDRGA
jgi:ethanolamine utilization protein EutA